MPKQKSKSKPNLAFFIPLIANYIRYYEYKSENEALEAAKKAVAKEDADNFELVINKVFERYTIGKTKAVFVTKPIIHEYNTNKELSWDSKTEGIRKYNAGRATITLDLKAKEGKYPATITFEAQDFKHGHVYHNGTIGCFGGYKNFILTMRSDGPLKGIMDLWSFCRFSRYGTLCGG